MLETSPEICQLRFGDHSTLVQDACELGRDDVLKLILQISTRHIETGMGAAAKGGHLKCVNTLIDFGADPIHEGGSHTPLRLAAEKGHLDLVP